MYLFFTSSRYLSGRILSTGGKDLSRIPCPKLTVKVRRSSLLEPSVTGCCRQCSTSSNAFEGEKLPSNILSNMSKSSATALKVKKISQAMKAYLERAKSHENFLKMKGDEFEIGKRHLANMMGLDAETLTQADVDKAIEYLLPSGLYKQKARPMMKPPEILYPKEKAAQFDESGRPFSAFFYTTYANYYETLHKTVTTLYELDNFEDRMIRQGFSAPPPERLLNTSGSEWLGLDTVRDMFLEKITEEHYKFLIESLTRLAEHPYSFRCKDFIWKFRKDFPDVSALEVVPELMYDEDGRPYMTAHGTKKTLSKATVTVRGNGTGKIEINGKDILYFPILQDREQILYPLQVSDLWGKVDIEATVEGTGSSSPAGAIRYALSMCLRCFVDAKCREIMRLAGLLTLDTRKQERKKPGQKGARAKFKWKKR